MSSKERVKSIINIASSSLVTFIIKEQILNLTGIFGYIIPVVVGAFTYTGLNILLDNFNQISWLRKKFHPNSDFEGHWIQEISKKDSPYISAFSIFYNKQNDRFELEGITISTSQIESCKLDDINLHSRWESTVLLFESGKRKLTYVYTSIIYEEKRKNLPEISSEDSESDFGRKIDGLCIVKFAPDWREGDGYLVEGSSTSNHDYLKFKFKRIDDTEFQKIYKNVNSYTQTRKMLAVHYYEKRMSIEE